MTIRQLSSASTGSALLAVALLALGAVTGHADPISAMRGNSVLDHTMKRLDGSEQNLADYKGQVVLMVNTASKCGLTPQYEGLEALYRKYKDRGFVVLGFPANDFMGQEPGTDAQIADFCRSTYGIEFPMFSKITVKGEGMHPIYRELTSQPAPIGGAVKWNFQKYLLDRNGNVVAKFEPQVTPDAPELVKKLEDLLGPAS